MGDVGYGRPHVLSRDDAARERADKAAVLAVEIFAHLGIVVIDVRPAGHDAFPASPPETGQGVLMGHPLSQPEPVPHVVLDRVVSPVADSAGCLAAAGPGGEAAPGRVLAGRS